MDAAAPSNFSDLTTTTGCCQSWASLNDLQYGWPAGFGSFVLEAMNPDVPDLAPDQLTQLETVLGCRLRRIWVHL
jgi:hypothetical protein